MKGSPNVGLCRVARHAVFAALACAALHPSSVAAQDDESVLQAGDETEQDPGSAGDEELGLSAAAEGEADATLSSDAIASDADAVDAAADVTDAEPGSAGLTEKADAARVLKLNAGAGVGVGTLSFERPTPTGVQVLRETPFGAAELFVRTHIWPRAPLSLDVLLAYQSTFGLVMQLQPLFALPQNVDVRWQRGELSVAPVVRLGAAANAPALAFPTGFAFAALTPSGHAFSVKSFVLGGPNVRAELRMALGELVALRVGPEAQWIMLTDSTLRRAGACCGGFAVGAQAAIEARVGPVVRASIAYRQAHTFVPAGAWRFKDVERFLTARLAGEI